MRPRLYEVFLFPWGKGTVLEAVVFCVLLPRPDENENNVSISSKLCLFFHSALVGRESQDFDSNKVPTDNNKYLFLTHRFMNQLYTCDALLVLAGWAWF